MRAIANRRDDVTGKMPGLVMGVPGYQGVGQAKCKYE